MHKFNLCFCNLHLSYYILTTPLEEDHGSLQFGLQKVIPETINPEALKLTVKLH
jgi:hypothetical protein